MRTPAAFLVCIVSLAFLPGCATLMKAGGIALGNDALYQAGESQEKVERKFNEEEKYYIGRTVAATLMADDAWLDRAALTQYVNQVGETLALASERPEMFHGYHFAVLDAAAKVNAFACPGGFLFVSSGLLKLCRNEDELAAVLAHEISHIVLEHPIEAIQESHNRAVYALVGKAAIKEIGKQNETVSSLSGLLGDVTKEVVKAVAHGYSRDKEKQADLMAVDILGKAGYPPEALAAVLARMDTKSCYHGDPKIRAADVTAAAEQKAYPAQAYPARDRRFAQETR